MSFWWQAAELATSMLFTSKTFGVKIIFLGKSSQKYRGKANDVLCDEKVLKWTNYKHFRSIMNRFCLGFSYSFRDVISLWSLSQFVTKKWFSTSISLQSSKLSACQPMDWYKTHASSAALVGRQMLLMYTRAS